MARPFRHRALMSCDERVWLRETSFMYASNHSKEKILDKKILANQL